MADSFTKLANSIITSTIWSEDSDTKVVWITMLALADRHGEVSGTVPGLARLSGVSIEACVKALQKFQSPDPYSRSKDHEGRRVEEIDGGWALLSYARYRNMASESDQREKTNERVRRHRAKRASDETVDVTACNTGNGSETGFDTEAEAEAEAEAEKEKEIPSLVGLETPSEALALAIYNETAKRAGLPQASKLTDPRRRHLRARLKDCAGIDGWRKAMAKVEASPFLTGRTAQGNGHESWRCDLDFLLREASFTKLMEGRYDARGVAGRQPVRQGGFNL